MLPRLATRVTRAVGDQHRSLIRRDKIGAQGMDRALLSAFVRLASWTRLRRSDGDLDGGLHVLHIG